jgi:DNA repair protein RecO (recombination protein O)
MSALSTEAIVLHAFDYLESSRILRLATRDAGVRSVLARGARRSARRFGSALDLFARGTAQLHVKPGRELDTLAAFEVTRSHARLAADLGRFAGASALAELTLRFTQGTADPGLFDAIATSFDEIESAPRESVREAVLAGAWRIVAELGFAPTVDACATCHAPIADDEVAMFSHPAGGALCRSCARLSVAGRVLPAEARAAIRAWAAGGRIELRDDASLRAHQRLLREFLQEHLVDGRPLRALDVWEHQPWASGVVTADGAVLGEGGA